MGYFVLAVLAVILLIVGPILGIIAFGRTRRLENRVRVLEARAAVGATITAADNRASTPAAGTQAEPVKPPAEAIQAAVKPEPVSTPKPSVAETGPGAHQTTKALPNMFASLEASLSGSWMVCVGAGSGG